MRRAAVTTALASLLTFGGLAAARADTDPADHERAVALAIEAERLYSAGNFDAAIDRLRQAIAIDSDPRLLYNLGRAYERRGNGRRVQDMRAALTAFTTCLERISDDALRSQVEERITVLRQLLAAREARPAATPKAPPPQLIVVEDRSPSAVPWVVVGVGAAATLVGLVLGVRAQSLADDANAARERDVFEAQSLSADANDSATLANVALVAGGAVAVVGLVWGVVDVARSQPAPTAPAGARSSMALRWSWP